MTDSSIISPFGTSSIHSWRHIPSRPSSRRSSRARSDTTERPDASTFISPSLSHGIDHIKVLIGRSQEAPALPPSGILTAQVFRQPTPTISTVTIGQIYHELDQLKRRIRQELDQQQQQPLIRRISQIDPGQESEESDLEDGVLDEREEELDKARDDVVLVRERLDGLLERAEAKVDGLTNEKEKLESTLAWYQHELDRSEAERRSLAQDLDKIRTDIRHLNGVLEGANGTYEEQKRRSEDLQKEKLQADAAYDKAQNEVTNLLKLNRELESALGSARTDHSKSAEQLRIHNEEHESMTTKLRSEIADLQKTCGDKDSEIELSRSATEQVQQKLARTETLVAETREGYETRLKELSFQAGQSKALSESALREVDSLKDEHNHVVKDRDASKVRIDELETSLDQHQVKLGAAVYAQQRLEKQVKDDGANHEQAIQEMQNIHDAERKQLEESLVVTKEGHSRELDTLRTSAAMELQTARAEHADEVAQLTAGSRSELDAANKAHTTALASAEELHRTELETVRSKYENRLRSLNDKLEQAVNDSEATATAHSAELEIVRSEYAARVQNLNDKLVQATKDSESAATAHISELETVRPGHETRLQTLNDKIEKAAVDSEATATAHASNLETLRAEYEGRLQALNDKLEQATKDSKSAATAHVSELEVARSEHGARLQAVSASMEEVKRQLAESETISASRIGELEKRVSSERNEKSVAVERLNEVETALQSRVKHLEAELKTAEQQVASLEETIAEMDRSGNTRLDGLTLRLSQQAEEFSKASAELISLREKTNAQIADMEASHRKVLEESEKRRQLLEEDHTQQISRLEKENSATVQSATAESEKKHRERVSHVEAQTEARIRTLMQEQHQQSIAEMRRDHEAQILDITTKGSTEADGRIGELRTMHESRLAGLDDAHKNALDDMSGAHAAAMESAEDRYKSLEEAHKAAQESIQQHFDDQISKLKEEHASGISQLKHDLENSREAVRAADERCESLASSHATSLAEIQKRHEVTVEQLQSTHQSALAAAGDNEQQVASQAAAEHQQLVKSLQSDHQSAMSAVRKDLEAATEELQSVKTNAEAGRVELQRVADEAKRALTAAEARFKTELTERDSAAESSIAELNETHAQEVLRIREDMASHDTYQQSADSNLEAAEEKHQRTRDELVNAHGAALASLENDFNIAREQQSATHETAMRAIRTELDAARHDAKNLRLKHLDEVQQLQVKHETDQQSIRSETQEEITLLRRTADEAIESRNRTEAEHGSSLEALKGSQSLEIDALKARLEAELAKHSNTASEHENNLKSLHETNAESDSGRQEEFETTISQLKADYDKRLEDAEEKHNRAMSYREGVWTAMFDELKAAHDKSLAETLEANASDLRAVEKRHNEDLANVSADTLSDSQEGDAEAGPQSHEATGDAAAKAQRSRRAEVRSLKRRHQDAIAHVRSTARKQYAAQITDLEEAHQRELQAAEERIAALKLSSQNEPDGRTATTAQEHQDEISRLQLEYQSRISDLERQLQDLRAVNESTRQADHQPGIEDLKARLDAALEAQAEAEKQLVALRRNSSSSDKGSRERRGSDTQLHALQLENRNLKKQLSLSSLNLRQPRGGSGRISPIVGSNVDVASLNLRMANIEEEREALRNALKKRSEEKLDLVRQNDFLVKELEVSLARSSKGKQPSAARSDAMVQTEDSVLEPSGFPEPRADFSVVHAVREKVRTSWRPQTPSSPIYDQGKKEEDDMLEKPRSFEGDPDYSRSERELQKAKDELAAEYTARIDLLASERERMEETVTQKQQAAFAQEREELLASFGAHEYRWIDQPTPKGLSAAQAIALRAAEQKLVADYHKRLASRKSQIASKHDYDFQNIAADYDRKVGELLDDKSKWEDDLSVDPSKFKHDLDALNKSSLILETERGRATRRPLSLHSTVSPIHPSESSTRMSPTLRSPVSPTTTAGASRRIRLTASPHASDSRPRQTSSRIVLVPEEDDIGQDTTYHPLRSRENHAPIQQHSLMRAKSPTKMQSPSSSVPSPEKTSNPVASNPMFSPVLPLTYNPGPLPPPGRRIRSRPPRDSAIEPSYKRLSAYVEEEEQKKASTPAKPGLLRRVRDKLSISSDHSHHSKPSDSMPPRPATAASHIAVMSSTPNDQRPSSAASWHAKRSGSKSARGRLG